MHYKTMKFIKIFTFISSSFWQQKSSHHNHLNVSKEPGNFVPKWQAESAGDLTMGGRGILRLLIIIFNWNCQSYLQAYLSIMNGWKLSFKFKMEWMEIFI